MNNWIYLVLSKNPKKNPPNATIGPLTLPSPTICGAHSLPGAHPWLWPGPARAPWGRHPATPRPTRAEGIARPSQGRPLVLLPVRRSWGCSPVLFSLCPCTTRARAREREREEASGLRRRPCCRPSLLLSNKAKKKKKKKVRALELWRARDNGLRLVWTSSILSAHVFKVYYCIRARAWSFCKFPKPFLCLPKKKSIWGGFIR